MCDSDSDSIPPAVILLVRCRREIWEHMVVPVIQEEEIVDVQNVFDENDRSFEDRISSKSVVITEQYVPVLSFKMDACAASCFRSLLVRSQVYRKLVWNHLDATLIDNSSPLIVAEIKTYYPEKEVIDYKFCNLVQRQVHERIEMDYIMSWLSTLGGAFSSLGDQFVHCAETAGKISVEQFKIALKLGDPTTLMRCQLYLSISLIQRQRHKEARKLIQKLYNQVKSQPESCQDKKIIAMCLGIWAKLKYEWHNRHLEKKRKCISS